MVGGSFAHNSFRPVSTGPSAVRARLDVKSATLFRLFIAEDFLLRECHPEADCRGTSSQAAAGRRSRPRGLWSSIGSEAAIRTHTPLVKFPHGPNVDGA
jgi:hypothetical protein